MAVYRQFRISSLLTEVRLAAAAFVLAALMAGCGGSGSGSPSGGVPGASFGGRVFGGGPQNPISGSTVTLFEMTTSGYGAAANQLATTTSNSSGGFSFTPGYTCTSSTDQTYVTATGGDAGGGANSAIGMMSLTGACSGLGASTFLVVNELTTAAAEWALAQFSDSTGANFGTSSTNTAGLNNAVNQAESDLVVSSLNSGGTPSNVGIPASFLPWSSSSNNCTSATNCDGLERLDTVANIIAACINSSGPSSTACNTLLTATSNSTDTLEAAHVIVTNPTTNCSTIYSVQTTPSLAPFQPALGSAPSDFTLPLNFAPAGASFDNPSALALDSAGNVFVANVGSGIGATGSVSRLTVSSGYATGQNYNNSNVPGASFDSPFALAVDSSGNVFVANNSSSVRPSGSVSELTAASGYMTGANFSASNVTFTPNTSNLFDGPSSIALDTSDNVFVANHDGDSVSELTEANSYTMGMVYDSSNVPSAAFDKPSSLAIDSSADIFVANVGSGIGATGSVSELTEPNYLTNPNNFNPNNASFDSPASLELDSTDDILIANNSSSVRPSGSVSLLTAPSYGTGARNFSPTSASFDGPSSLAIDSVDDVFIANHDGNSVSQLVRVLIFATGENFAPSGAAFDGPSAVAADSAGNVFVANKSGDSVSELIGLAAPVLTPIQACLIKNQGQGKGDVCVP